MAVVKWGIDDPNNPRNKENLELTKELEEERRNFVGTATIGAIRTNPDGTVMRPMKERKEVETGEQVEQQTAADHMADEGDTNATRTENSQDEHEHENFSAVEELEGSLSPYSYASYSSVSTTDERVLPPGWLRGISSDGSRMWYTAQRFSGPIINETPTQVPENYVFNERTQQWKPSYEL